jgi:hypothetical protein
MDKTVFDQVLDSFILMFVPCIISLAILIGEKNVLMSSRVFLFDGKHLAVVFL